MSTCVLKKNENDFEFRALLESTQNVVMTHDIFSLENNILASIVENTRSLFVLTETISKLYGDSLKRYISMKTTGNHKIMVIRSGEKFKTMETVLSITKEAALMKLDRRSLIIGVGGGICTDLCGFAAAIYDRGVPHIKIPTTFLGLVDAGIGIKNGINANGRKNSIGSFYPPQWSILDLNFISTLEQRQIRNGIAEVLKMALVLDYDLFELLEKEGDSLINNKLSPRLPSLFKLVHKSVSRMLEQLSDNLYEIKGYKRAVDFGHTFSPYIEVSSNYNILHGEAVSIDMVISVLISLKLELLSEASADRIITLMKKLKLPIYSLLINCGNLWESLSVISAHRNGSLNLVVPTAIGQYTFLENLNKIGVAGLDSILNNMRNL